MASKLYKIIEIFSSLQGEGYWSGWPAIFVRFAGCNLDCEFCDTDFSGGVDMTAEQIRDQIKTVRTNPRTPVIFTGGEPLLQLDRELLITIFPNLEKSSAAKYLVRIETNGTLPIADDIRQLIGWVSVSYKPGTTPALTEGNELKMLVSSTGALVESPDISSGNLAAVRLQDFDFSYVFLQPCLYNNTDEDEKAKQQAIAMSKMLGWPVSFQMHKLVGIE